MASLLLSSWGSPTPSNNIMKIQKKTNLPGPHYQRGSTSIFTWNLFYENLSLVSFNKLFFRKDEFSIYILSSSLKK
ncbi:unnamed protein product, partial [Vitis vinifera]|uniref:Uncharacterized protein n=1 Tax=Vitis vinifera TaxID=29760 RepID=D7TF87_VITVI